VARNLTKSVGVEYEGEPSLIDFGSDPQVNDTTWPTSSSLGFSSGLPISSQLVSEASLELEGIVGEVGGLLNTPPSQTPSLLDEDMTEGLSLPLDLDGLPLLSPQRFPHLNLRLVVPGAPQGDHIGEAHPQEPLIDPQDDSRPTSAHEEDSAESTVESVTPGIGPRETDPPSGL